MRFPRVGIVLLLGAVLASALGCRTRQPPTEPAPIERLRALQAAGRHEETLAEADRLIQRIPASESLSYWEVPFQRRLVPDARLGRQFGYFLLDRANTGAGDSEPPDLPISSKYEQELATIRRDELQTVTCVDLRTGRRLWTRPLQREIIGIDPRDDSLWLWRLSEWPLVERWDAQSGESTHEQFLPRDLGIDKARREIAGIRHEGISIWKRTPRSATRPRSAIEIDLETVSLVPDCHPPDALTENRLAYIDNAPQPKDVTHILLRPIAPHDTPIWKAEVPGVVLSPPIRTATESGSADDVLVLAGFPYGHGAVHRLHGQGGKEVWRTVLPEPAYSPKYTQLRTGSYPMWGWPPISHNGRHLAVAGDYSNMYLLDATDGRIVAKYPAGAPLLEAPRFVDEMLVLATFDGMKAVALKQLLVPDQLMELQVRRARVESLLALDRAAEALQQARDLVRAAPGSAGAWQALALASERSEDEQVRSEATAVWARYMEAANVEVLPRLQGSHGLVRRIPTAPIFAPLVPTDLTVLAATIAGELITLDSENGEIAAREPAPVGLRVLDFDGNALNASSVAEGVVRLREFVRPPNIAPEDALWGVRNRPAIQLTEQQRRSLYFGGTLLVDGKLIEPLDGGGVRVTENDDPRDFPPVVEGVGKWRLVRGHERLLGYSGHAVWELDEQFRPARRLVNLESATSGQPQAPEILQVAENEGAIGILIPEDRQLILQVRNQDSGDLVRQAPVDVWRRETRHRLIPLGDGFLFSGRSLVWLPNGPDAPVWRFDLHVSFPTQYQRHNDEDRAEFGIPRVIGDCLFVAPKEGGVYVFRIPQITGEADREPPD